jgi:hypothetical protein
VAGTTKARLINGFTAAVQYSMASFCAKIIFKSVGKLFL